MRAVASCEQWDNTALAQRVAMRLRSHSRDHLGCYRVCAPDVRAPPRRTGNASTRGSNWVTSFRLAPVSVSDERNPVGRREEWASVRT